MNSNKVINFYGKRWVYFIISLTFMTIGIISIFLNGVQLDIQFKGGSLIKYTYTGDVDANTASDVATKALNMPVTTQTTTDIASGQKRLIINVSGNNGLDASVQQGLDKALKDKFPDAGLKLSDSSIVEAYYGQRFFRNGMIAIFLSGLLVMVYVWYRFNRMGGLSAGVMALVALLHDVLVVFFTCVIFKIPIGDSFVAVALTIIGYSVNDTIVIYDRIRENYRNLPKQPIETITNLSITQSITRSINTNLAVLISISIVYVLALINGIESIQSFALPMAIGSISGCYSTICIAGPLWVMWKKHKGTNKAFGR
ncbi:MAG: protein translocase subunit SecF [Bacillota bacterium]|nr:protein translocase subunit SecF [Bacillota bacterium]